MPSAHLPDANVVEDTTPIQPKYEIKANLYWTGDIAISPDGAWLIAGQATTSVKVIDLNSGMTRGTTIGHTNRTMATCITPDGLKIISGSDDNTLRSWDAQPLRPNAMDGLKVEGDDNKSRSVYVLPLPLIRIFSGHTDAIRCVIPLSDSKHLLSASKDGTVKLWETESGNCIRTFFGHRGEVASVAVSSDGVRAVSGGSDGQLKIWEVGTGTCLATLRGHPATVRSIRILKDGQYAVSASEDWTIKIWDLERFSCVGTLEGHENSVSSIAISPDEAFIASVGRDQALKIWDVYSGECLKTIINTNTKELASVVFSPDGRRVITAGGDMPSSVYVYELDKIGRETAVKVRRYINAKIVLIGESGVGKSGLAYRLVEDRFVRTHSTHGMHVWRLTLPIEKDEKAEREALLWDLAGQDDYRLIHQLFLDETAVALILINPQHEDPFSGLGDWINALEAAIASRSWRRQVVKLLVVGRADVGSIKVSRKRMDEFIKEHGFAGYIVTSAKRGDNCSDRDNGNKPSALKCLIGQHIPWNKLPWTTTPRLLVEIKNALLDLAEKEDIPLIRFAELCQRFDNSLTVEQFGVSNVRTAITLLGNQGLIMPLKFGDLVLMTPEAINNYAAALIRAARAQADEIGSVAELDALNLKIDLDGVERLPPSDERLLMRAIVQMLLDKSLCIAEETPNGRYLIFPSQYRREREIPTYPDIYLSYTFTGELQTIYTTLIVRLWYSQMFKQKELWRNAAEFITNQGGLFGLINQRVNEGQGTLSLFFDHAVSNELKVLFIEYVNRHLQRYARNLQRDRRYACQHCKTPVRDLELIRKLSKEGKVSITCQNCEEKVPLIDSIELHQKSDPVARQVVSMDRVATQGLEAQAMEQTMIGHLMAVCGEANQLFRIVNLSQFGIDGEIEFKTNEGVGSGSKVYVQIKPGECISYHRSPTAEMTLKVTAMRYIKYWLNDPIDLYVVTPDAEGTICWMNVTRALKLLKTDYERQIEINERSKVKNAADDYVPETLGQKRRAAALTRNEPIQFEWRFVFKGQKLDATAVWQLRDELIPHERTYAEK